jgi:hypothetical protein
MWLAETAKMACNSGRAYMSTCHCALENGRTGNLALPGGSCSADMNVARWIIFGSVGTLSKKTLTMWSTTVCEGRSWGQSDHTSDPNGEDCCDPLESYDVRRGAKSAMGAFDDLDAEHAASLSPCRTSSKPEGNSAPSNH